MVSAGAAMPDSAPVPSDSRTSMGIGFGVLSQLRSILSGSIASTRTFPFSTMSPGLTTMVSPPVSSIAYTLPLYMTPDIRRTGCGGSTGSSGSFVLPKLSSQRVTSGPIGGSIIRGLGRYFGGL